MTAQFHSDIRTAKAEAEKLAAITGFEHAIRPTTGGFTVHMTAKTIFGCDASLTRATDVSGVVRVRHLHNSRRVGRFA